MEIFDRLSKLDKHTFWWNISEDGFDIYLNCNDLVCGTAYGICLYHGIGASHEDLVIEGLDFLDEFLKNHQKSLDNFYNIYNFAAYKEFVNVFNEFRGNYELKYDNKAPINNILD